MADLTIRRVEGSDRDGLLRMRMLLWPDSPWKNTKRYSG